MERQCTITISENDLMILAGAVYNDAETMTDMNMQMLDEGNAQKEDQEGYTALMECYRRFIIRFMTEAAKLQDSAQAKHTRRWLADRNAAIDLWIARYARQAKRFTKR